MNLDLVLLNNPTPPDLTDLILANAVRRIFYCDGAYGRKGQFFNMESSNTVEKLSQIQQTVAGDLDSFDGLEAVDEGIVSVVELLD